jgi:hypothetical protein
MRNHCYGMVGFIKQLTDEQAALRVTQVQCLIYFSVEGDLYDKKVVSDHRAGDGCLVKDGALFTCYLNFNARDSIKNHDTTAAGNVAIIDSPKSLAGVNVSTRKYTINC